MSDSIFDEIGLLLPFVLHPDNIARYADGAVWIGSRKDYPLQKRSVRCDSVEEVAQAIEQMVTQGAGPWQAAACGLALAGAEADQMGDKNKKLAHLQAAQQRLVATRPTNTALARRLEQAMSGVAAALQLGGSCSEAVLGWLATTREQIYKDYASRGRAGAELIDDGDGVLTMCFAEASFILALAFAKEQGKQFTVYVPETRPFLQGAKLTAPSVYELGVDVVLVGDNMPAFLHAQQKIHKYFTAADLITMDGHVVNKVGTYQHAVVCAYHNVPYYAFAWGMDPTKPNRESVELEMRDPEEMKQFKGEPTTHPDIPSIYPAFDITPPELVSGIITKHGLVKPEHFASAYNQKTLT